MAMQLPLAQFPRPPRWPHLWARGRRLLGRSRALTVLALILISTAVLGLTFAINPQWDLALTRGFYDPATKQFPLTFNPTISWLRDQAVFVTIACMACLAASVALKLVLPQRRMVIPGRAVIFLVLTFALGPGLLVNGILKEHWSRPRPAEVTEFGGDKAFMPWWDPRGGCDQNCSFVSGETSTSAWTLAPAILVPGPLGTATIAAAAMFTLGMGVMRFVVGGHFFTDVLFAFLFTSLLIWTVHGLIYRWPKTALDDDKIERAIGGFGLFIRNDMTGPLQHHIAAAWQLVRDGVSTVHNFTHRLAAGHKPEASRPDVSSLGPLGIDPELMGRVQDLREAYLGAPEGRIVAEALELFITDRLRAEPEVKRRYEEARKRRLGLSGSTVRLVANEQSHDEKDNADSAGNVVALPSSPASESS
jgi:lipid A 4'-phosphatase